MHTNLLDLNNDVLNIIGDFVKKDNAKKIKKMNGDITFNEYVDRFNVCDYSAYIKYKEFYLFIR
jgi:hypothetical protein